MRKKQVKVRVRWSSTDKRTQRGGTNGLDARHFPAPSFSDSLTPSLSLLFLLLNNPGQGRQRRAIHHAKPGPEKAAAQALRVSVREKNSFKKQAEAKPPPPSADALMLANLLGARVCATLLCCSRRMKLASESNALSSLTRFPFVNKGSAWPTQRERESDEAFH